jgi:hypothetical protein
MIVMDYLDPNTTLGIIFEDLTSVKQPDENFFQAAALNSRLCDRYIDYTLHWTDKDSMQEVRSATSEYNILSPGVLSGDAAHVKLAEVRQQYLWAFFARKFDDSEASEDLKLRLDNAAGANSQASWTPLVAPAMERLIEVLVSNARSLVSVERLDRNIDGLFAIQTLRILTQGLPGQAPQMVFLREKPAMPAEPHPLLALRIGCSWDKVNLVFNGDVSLVASSDRGRYRCETLWAVAHWRMSRRPVAEELMLVWVDPMGTPMQHVPLTISEHSVVLWHRYTATLPLPHGRWTVQLMSMDRRVLVSSSFFAYHKPSDIPWHTVEEHFEVLRADPTA